MEKEQRPADSFTAGIGVTITIYVDSKSMINDGIAFGACLNDLQKEGWQLADMVRREDGGVEAKLHRGWHINRPHPYDGPTEAQAPGESHADQSS